MSFNLEGHDISSQKSNSFAHSEYSYKCSFSVCSPPFQPQSPGRAGQRAAPVKPFHLHGHAHLPCAGLSSALNTLGIIRKWSNQFLTSPRAWGWVGFCEEVWGDVTRGEMKKGNLPSAFILHIFEVSGLMRKRSRGNLKQQVIKKSLVFTFYHQLPSSWQQLKNYVSLQSQSYLYWYNTWAMLGVSALATVEFQELLLGSNPALALRSHFLWKDVCHHSVASVVLRAKGVACKHTTVFHVHLSHFLPKCKKCFWGSVSSTQWKWKVHLQSCLLN